MRFLQNSLAVVLAAGFFVFKTCSYGFQSRFKSRIWMSDTAGSKTAPASAIANAVAGKSWLRCKPIGGIRIYESIW
jgi:hypothetical protein